MPISLNPKTFYGFFTAVLKSVLNLENFEKKDESHSFKYYRH